MGESGRLMKASCLKNPSTQKQQGENCRNAHKCGTFEPGIASREGGHIYEEVSGTLRANPGDNQMTVYGIDLLAGRGGANYTVDICPTIVRGDRTMHGVCYGADMYNQDLYEETEPTLGVNCGISTGRNGVVFGIDQQGGKGQANFTEDVAPTVLSDSHGTPHAVAYEDLK